MEEVRERPLRHYCVVRADLLVGQKFAMLGHAAGESAVLRTPPDDQTHFLALQGPPSDMSNAVLALRSRGFMVKLVVEDEGPLAGEVLAFGVEPTRDNRVGKILYHFPMASAGSQTRK